MLYFMLLPLLFGTFLVKTVYERLRKRRDLCGRHVVITGGSSGIGRSLALHVIKRGAHVTLIARGVERLKETAAFINGYKSSSSQEINYEAVDCANATEVEKKINLIDARRPIYMFVNCAGMAIAAPLEETSFDDIKMLIDVNYLATVYPTKCVIPKLKQRNEGILVLTGSQGGLFGIFGYSIYASMKFAIRGLAEVLSMELREHNVTVTLSLPPDTDTPGFEKENLNKPTETRLISESGGLFNPDDVARQLLEDALDGKFFSTVGFESWLLTTLTVGMSPFRYTFDVIVQALLLGPIRLTTLYYLRVFQRIITRCHRNKAKVE